MHEPVMGCYNGTCGLSTLPILEGEDVFVFLLRQTFDPAQPTAESSYPNAFWAPHGLPFRARYNGYRWVEGVPEDDVAAAVTLEYLSGALFEREAGSSPIREPEVRQDALSIEQLGEWLHDDRVQIIRFNRIHAVAAMLVRADLFETMMQTCGVENVGLFDSFDPQPYARLRAETRAHCETVIDVYDPTFRARRYAAGYDVEARFWSSALRSDIANFIPAYNVISEAARCWPWATVPLCQGRINALVDAASHLGFLDGLLRCLRRHWGPQTGAGSQDQDTAPYRALCAATLAAARTIDTYWEYEEFEDEMEDDELAFHGS